MLFLISCKQDIKYLEREKTYRFGNQTVYKINIDSCEWYLTEQSDLEHSPRCKNCKNNKTHYE